MAMTLGELVRVDPREHWKDEVREFIPWLARPENITIPGETLDIDLEVVAHERNVGPFRADILCKDTTDDHWVLVGDVGSFPQKLDALLAEGLIGKKNRDFLEAALNAGSAASHRGHQPSGTAVSHVMDIMENHFQAVYVLESAADELKKTTPPRQRAGGTEKT